MVQTLLESGFETDSVVEMIGQVLIERRPGYSQWNAQLNRRRFELIDKEIQGTLSPAERIELAGLTKIMRDHLESEANLPMKGAKALHRQLLELGFPDDLPNLSKLRPPQNDRREGLELCWFARCQRGELPRAC